MDIISTPEFMEWLNKESNKSKAQIALRLQLLSGSNHFGDFKSLGDKLYELRWRNGRRIYFSILSDYYILLIGGYKNGQVKDIRRARKTLQSKWIEDLGSN